MDVDYPKVSVELCFTPQGAWFTTYMPIQDYWQLLSSGKYQGIVLHEVKVIEWLPEEEEYKPCYMAYNIQQKSWRIGYDT